MQRRQYLFFPKRVTPHRCYIKYAQRFRYDTASCSISPKIRGKNERKDDREFDMRRN